MTEFNIKFLFADGTNMEELFDAGTTVADAKMKLISKWPEGECQRTFNGCSTSSPPSPKTESASHLQSHWRVCDCCYYYLQAKFQSLAQMTSA